MRKDEPATPAESAQPTERDFLATCTVLLVALACSIVVIASPRPVQPSRLPALRVPLAQGRRAFADVALDATEALPRTPWFARWYELYSEVGLNEREQSLDLAMVAEQHAELARLTRENFPELGREGVRALRDALTARALDAMPRRQPAPEAYGLLGGFPALLLRYGYIDDAATPLAPTRVIENLYHQRFNLLCGRPLDSDLEDFDRMLAEGWIALHGEKLPAQRRAQAARVFMELGGTDAREAFAIWLYHGELIDDATNLLQHEYARTGALRVRNMLLFSMRGSEAPPVAL